MRSGSRHSPFPLWIVTGLLLLFWLTRLAALDAFPPFLDESVHIHFGERSLQISPLALAAEGRLFTIWWYMLFQAFQAAPLWTARAATVLAVLPGAAAAVAVGRLLAGWRAGILAGLLILLSSFHFFFERLALADTLSAAAALAALGLAARLSKRIDRWDAALCGTALFIAIGFKVSALPYLGIPLAGALTLSPVSGRWRDRAGWLAAALAVAVGLTGLFALTLRFFDYDLFFLIGMHNPQGADGLPARVIQNMPGVVQAFTAYSGLPAALGLAGATAVLIVRRQWFLPLCLFGPLIALLASERQTTRFYLIPAAVLLLCGTAGLACLPARWRPAASHLAILAALVWGLLQGLPFAWTQIHDPASLALPPSDYAEYVTSDASGFGLNEVYHFLNARRPRLVLGLLPNCQSLRYMALADFQVECPRINPNGSDIDSLTQWMLEKRGDGVYAVLEDSPYVPQDAPGVLLTAAARPNDGPTLAVYLLEP